METLWLSTKYFTDITEGSTARWILQTIKPLTRLKRLSIQPPTWPGNLVNTCGHEEGRDGDPGRHDECVTLKTAALEMAEACVSLEYIHLASVSYGPCACTYHITRDRHDGSVLSLDVMDGGEVEDAGILPDNMIVRNLW